MDIFTDLYYFPTKRYLNDYIVMPYSKENNIAYPFIHIHVQFEVAFKEKININGKNLNAFFGFQATFMSLLTIMEN